MPGLKSPWDVDTPKWNAAFAINNEFISRNNFEKEFVLLLRSNNEPKMIHPGALIAITSVGDISIPIL